MRGRDRKRYRERKIPSRFTKFQSYIENTVSVTVSKLVISGHREAL